MVQVGNGQPFPVRAFGSEDQINVSRYDLTTIIEARVEEIFSLVLQEIKQVTEMFPSDELTAAGYRSLANGQKTYNGVAVISREEATDPDFEIPGLDDPQRRRAGDLRPR